MADELEVPVRTRLVSCLFALLVALAGLAVAGCSGADARADPPGLASPGITLTTVKPTRQDLTNRVSLSGKITLTPIFGLVAPVDGTVRYLDVRPPQTTPTKPTRVATV